MRLESLTLRGFMTAFAGREVTIPVGQLPDGLIAIVGDNGSGKTTLLEAAPASLFRQFMSRTGDLKTYAQDRDSAIETTWLIGDKWYQARVTVEGIRGGANAALFDSAIETVRPLNDGKVSTYDSAVAKIFPPLHVFKASAFAAQNKSGSFVHASKKDRRDIFASFLNLDRLVAMSQTAKACAAEVDKVRLRLQQDVKLLEIDTADHVIDGLQRQAIGLEDERACHESRRDLRAADIAKAEQRLEQLAEDVAAAAAVQQKVDAVDRALVQKRTDLASHQARHDVMVRGHAAELQQLQQERAGELAAIDAKLQSTEEADDVRALDEHLSSTLKALDEKIGNNRQILDQAEDIRAAVATVAAASGELEQLRDAGEVLRVRERLLAAARAENESLIASFTQPKTELARAEQDAALLDHVPCGGQGEYAGCQLLVNAQDAKATIASLQARLEGVVDALKMRETIGADIVRVADAIDANRKQVAVVERRLQDAKPMAAYADKLAAAEARIEELKAQRTNAERDYARQLTGVKEHYDRRRTVLLADRLRAIEAWATRESSLRQRHLARVQDSLEIGDALSNQVKDLSVEHVAAVLDLDRVKGGSAAAAQLQAELAQLRADREAAVTAIATATSDAAAVRRRLEELSEKAQRLTVLRGRLAKLDQELLEWQLLQAALDRDGLPALETDQAGPAISALTNQILADCFESRFSVELVTQVSRADGKGMKDDLTLLVTDNTTGQQRDIADLSGGEEIIIGEAFMSAISLFINERSQQPVQTFFRDETTGALTKENTQRYVRMLRKVMALGGVRQILFISHDPDAYALADAQIRVADGRVTTVLPPYSEAA